MTQEAEFLFFIEGNGGLLEYYYILAVHLHTILEILSHHYQIMKAGLVMSLQIMIPIQMDYQIILNLLMEMDSI